MRVLALADFDPAGVLVSHREALRGTGIDYRIALRQAFNHDHARADWVAEHLGWRDGTVVPAAGRLDGLREFAAQADVVIRNPGIGQPWADNPALPFEITRDVDWDLSFPVARTLVLLHGSAYAWAHRHAYYNVANNRGWIMAATTLDYACDLGVVYLPPAIFDVWGVAQRGDEPRVVQAPTNRALCNTAELIEFIQRKRIPTRIVEGRSHLEAMSVKLNSNIGFDHLRGAFSVNTLENALVGLAPVGVLLPKYRNHAQRLGLPDPPVTLAPDADQAWETLFKLAQDAAYRASVQQEARAWALESFNARAVAGRLRRLLLEVL